MVLVLAFSGLITQRLDFRVLFLNSAKDSRTDDFQFGLWLIHAYLQLADYLKDKLSQIFILIYLFLQV